MTTIRCLTCAIALTLPLFAAGCGKPAMVPVQGKVTFRGYPVNNGVIVLTPEHNKGPLAVGLIRNDGSFVLSTGDHPGAYPGDYKITVSSLQSGSSMSEGGARFEAPQSALPPKYREYEQSWLTCKIDANRPNNLPVNLPD